MKGSTIVPLSKCVTLHRGLEAEKGSEVMRTLVRSNPAAITALLGGTRDENGNWKECVYESPIMDVPSLSSNYYNGTSCQNHPELTSLCDWLSSCVFDTPVHICKCAWPVWFSCSAVVQRYMYCCMLTLWFITVRIASCVGLCFSLSTGKFISQQELVPATQTQCALARSTTLQGMGMCSLLPLHADECLPSALAACYDAKSHCVWTLCDNGVDVWDCAGRCRIALHQLAQRLADGSIEKLIPSTCGQAESISVAEAISLMLRHIGIESCQITPSKGVGGAVVHSLPLLFLQQCCDQLEWSVEEKNWANVQATVITLQVCCN